MTDQAKPELTPEAIKLLNDLAAGRDSGLNLTSEGKANLEKLVNETLPDFHKGQRDGAIVHAIVCFALAGGALLFGLNALLEDFSEFIEDASGWALLSLLPIILVLVGIRSLRIYSKS